MGLQKKLKLMATQLTTVATQLTTVAALTTYTSTEAEPSATSRIQLGGYRKLTATTGVGGTTGSPLLASDYFVEVSGTVAAVYLPAVSAVVAGKVYFVRNNRTASMTGGIKVGSTTVPGATSIGAGATIVLLNTGTAWRCIGLFSGGTKGGAA